MKIPTFKSVKDEAAFWDSHDIGDYIEHMRPVKVVYTPKKEKKQTMTLRISPSVKKEVEGLARRHDISPSTLIRTWIVDGIRKTHTSEGK